MEATLHSARAPMGRRYSIHTCSRLLSRPLGLDVGRNCDHCFDAALCSRRLRLSDTATAPDHSTDMCRRGKSSVESPSCHVSDPWAILCRYTRVINSRFPLMSTASLHVVGHECHMPLRSSTLTEKQATYRPLETGMTHTHTTCLCMYGVLSPYMYFNK